MGMSGGGTVIYWILRCIILHTGARMLAVSTLLEVHLSPASWSDARRICAESFGNLMTQHFSSFAEIHNESWLDSSQSMWTGLYWLDTGFGNAIMDESCQSETPLDVDASSLNPAKPANSSQRCVYVSYANPAALHTGSCDDELPFACEMDVRLRASTFTRFEFTKDSYETIGGSDVPTCRRLCFENTALPCRSLIFLGDSASCLMMPNKYSLVGAGQNLYWQTSFSHYVRDTYEEKVSISNGTSINKTDSDAAEVRAGCTDIMCELHCAWLNELCACADYRNGTCRIFSQPSDCLLSSVNPSSGNVVVTIIKTVGDYQVLYLVSTDDPVTPAPFSPPQLSCDIPTPVPPTFTPSPSTQEQLSTKLQDDDLESFSTYQEDGGVQMTTLDSGRPVTTGFEPTTIDGGVESRTLDSSRTVTTEFEPTTTDGGIQVPTLDSSRPVTTEFEPTTIDSGVQITTLDSSRPVTTEFEPTTIDSGVQITTLDSSRPVTTEFEPTTTDGGVEITTLDSSRTVTAEFEPTTTDGGIQVPTLDSSHPLTTEFESLRESVDILQSSLPDIYTSVLTATEELSTVLFLNSATDRVSSAEIATTTLVSNLPYDRATYTINRRGDTRSSRFECDVTNPTASPSGMASLLTTFECRFLTSHTRTLLSNDTEFMDKVVEKLTIDKTKISSYRRKYESAYDGRQSARNVGILGVTILASVFGGLVLLDLTSLKKEIQLFIRNIKSRPKQTVKPTENEQSS